MSIKNFSYKCLGHEQYKINLFVVIAEAFMQTSLIQEHKDKTITHMVHEVLMWFGQPCLRPRMRENHFTIQQRILQRIESNTTIRFLKHPMFPYSLYPYPTTSPFAPPGTSHSFSYLYPPRIVSTDPSPSHPWTQEWLG